MQKTCPHCQSQNIRLVNTGSRVGLFIGALIGAAAVVAAAIVAFEKSDDERTTAAILGVATSAALGALGGMATGSVAGEEAGNVVDKIRETYECLDCHKQF